MAAASIKVAKPPKCRRRREARARQREAVIVVSSAKCSGLNNLAELTTSAALFRNGSIFLIARPPLLFKEGNIVHFQFIHTFYDRAPQAQASIASDHQFSWELRLASCTWQGRILHCRNGRNARPFGFGPHSLAISGYLIDSPCRCCW